MEFLFKLYIINMYFVAKSLVFANDKKSEYFMCNIGVKQGKNLSPLLFAIFLNDLEQYFIDKNVSGLEECTESILHSLGVYKLFLLFYADNTVLIAENVDSLQRALDDFSYDSYNYLAIKFSYNGRFCTAKKLLIEQATRAMYAIFRKARQHSVVLPILLYCCEIWGFEKLEDRTVTFDIL